MIVLGDIAELWEYRLPGNYVCMHDGSTEVAVIDCKHSARNKKEARFIPKKCIIPDVWNVEDKVIPGMKLLHFTDLSTQPWFYNHPNKQALNIYKDYRKWAIL